MKEDADPRNLEQRDGLAEAIFAGGCFWCVEAPFESVEGVESVVSGYTGGDQPHPSYEEVAQGRTDHREAVKILFDPGVVGYPELLSVFFGQIDPTDGGGQFADRGEHYTPAIFYRSEEQRRLAEGAIAALEEAEIFDAPVATKVLPAKEFYPAEEYHQDYYRKNAGHYQRYKVGSGRAGFIDEYGSPQAAVLRKWRESLDERGTRDDAQG